MSFWKISPGPHWLSLFPSCKGRQIRTYPYIYRETPVNLPVSSPFYTVELCMSISYTALCIFLTENFRITQKSRCMLSEDQLEKGIRNGWIVLIAYSKKTNLIVGCIISRPLGTLTHCSDFGKSWQLRSFQNTGFIDFFCVSELERKKGLGSHLLLCLDAYSSKKGRQIQFFQKEGLPLISLPPIWTGRYLSRQVKFKSDKTIQIVQGKETKETKESWNLFKGLRQTTLSGHWLGTLPVTRSDTVLYKKEIEGGTVYAAITDTFHIHIERTNKIGELLWAWFEPTGRIENRLGLADAIEKIIDSSGYSVMLTDSSVPVDSISWTADAPYSLYAYNFNPQQFFSLRPWFFF